MKKYSIHIWLLNHNYFGNYLEIGLPASPSPTFSHVSDFVPENSFLIGKCSQNLNINLCIFFFFYTEKRKSKIWTVWWKSDKSVNWFMLSLVCTPSQGELLEWRVTQMGMILWRFKQLGSKKFFFSNYNLILRSPFPLQGIILGQYLKKQTNKWYDVKFKSYLHCLILQIWNQTLASDHFYWPNLCY